MFNIVFINLISKIQTPIQYTIATYNLLELHYITILYYKTYNDFSLIYLVLLYPKTRSVLNILLLIFGLDFCMTNNYILLLCFYF